MLIDDSWFPAMVEDDKLVALDEHLAKRGIDADDTDFVKSALDLCRHPYRTGPYYALPFVGNTQIFFYRADVFEKYGLEHPPRTWADVLHAAKTIGSGEEGMYGYAQRPRPASTWRRNWVMRPWCGFRPTRSASPPAWTPISASAPATACGSG